MEPHSAPSMEHVAAGDSNHPVCLHDLEYVADVLGWSVDRTRRLIYAGQLQAYKIGSRSWRVSDAQINAFLASREVSA